MKQYSTLGLYCLFILTASVPDLGQAAARLRVATTSSTENSGLLSVLHPPFERYFRVQIDVLAVGTGKALRLGENGDVDLVLVHAPALERAFVEQGFGVQRWSLMHNDFVLLGPPSDPAGLLTSKTARQAMQRLVVAEVPFVSRADRSGTHRKELALWQLAGGRPVSHRYLATGQGMGAALQIANDKSAYVLSDRATWLGYLGRLQLAVLYQRDPALHNPYHVIVVNPERHPHVQYQLAQAYVAYLRGPEGQAIIGGFKVAGVPLFVPDVLPQSAVPAAGGSLEAAAPQQDAVPTAPEPVPVLLRALALIMTGEGELFTVAGTSLAISMLAVLLSLGLAVPLGLLVGLKAFPGRGMLLGVLDTMMALPTVLVGLLLYGILSRDGLLGAYGLLYTPAAITIGQAVLITPIMWNLFIAAVREADPRLQLLCRILGANLWQQTLIYASERRFALMAAVVAGFGRAIGEVGIAMMLGGNIEGYTRTMTTTIALETSKGDFEFAVALGLLLLLMAFFVNLVLRQFQHFAK